MLTSVKYKNESTIAHKIGCNNLIKLENSILDFESAKELAKSTIILDFIE